MTWVKATVSTQRQSAPETLMARFQRALDVRAVEQLVRRFSRPALAVAARLLTDRALAEDAVQEAFLRVVRKRDTYLPSKPFAGWFYTILRNVCLDMLRRRRREADAVQQAGRMRTAPQPATDSPETPALLDRLPRVERDVLVLRIMEDLTFREVAAALGITESAAKKRGQRGLRRLREHLADLRHAAVAADPQRIAP